MSCKFEIQIGDTDKFQCAADVNGWAWIWSHEKWRNPCTGCDKRINGKPARVDHELRAADFFPFACSIIKAQDWKEWGRRDAK